MEDGVLKEGFLVKRVSAPEHLRTLRAAGGRPGAGSPEQGPQPEAHRRPGGLGVCWAELMSVARTGGRWLEVGFQ